MPRISLKNYFLKNRSDEIKKLFRKKENLRVSLWENLKNITSQNVMRKITNKSHIWKTVTVEAFCQKRFNLQIELILLKKMIL